MVVHVGTSGWSYDHWDGVLYPPGSPARARLGHYAQRFRTVELNASFYRWPRTPGFSRWRERLPLGFQMSVKALRGLTHAPFVYVRLHGPDPDHLYGGSYADADIAWWVDRIREWDSTCDDVFVYFNNDGHGNAVRNALALQDLVQG